MADFSVKLLTDEKQFLLLLLTNYFKIKCHS